MKFAKYLHKELVFLNLNCKSKDELLDFLTKEVCAFYKLSGKDQILCDITKRENIKSTGLGKGLAIAHGREECMDRLYVAFARCDNGIDWSSVDNKPVRYIFFIVGPTKLENEYLEALSDISRIMVRHDIREGIHNAKDPEEVIRIIKDSGIRHEKRKV